jgi:hypothetical protein
MAVQDKRFSTLLRYITLTVLKSSNNSLIENIDNQNFESTYYVFIISKSDFLLSVELHQRNPVVFSYLLTILVYV